MKDRILDIDHLMVSATDSQAAGEAFEALGFTLTPRSVLPGMSNRLICFSPQEDDRCNFIEFLALDDEGAAPAIMSSVLLPAERPVSMVMVSADVEACAKRLRARGFDAPEPLHLKRDWVLPGGEVISPEFKVTIPAFGQAPLYWNVAEYVTPEHYRRPEFTSHANSATRFAGVLALAENPDGAAKHFADFWDAKIDGEADGTVEVSLDHVFLRLLPPQVAASRYPECGPDLDGKAACFLGFVVDVADIATAKGVLEGSGIPFQEGPTQSLRIAPKHAHGCLVEFRQQ